MWQRWEIACTRVMTMQACWSEKNVILLFESGGSQITSKTRKVWEFQASVRILGYTRRNVGIWKKCSLFFLELRFLRLGLRWYICISLFIYTSLGIFPHIPTLISHSIPFIPIYPSLSHTQDFFFAAPATQGTTKALVVARPHDPNLGNMGEWNIRIMLNT